MIQTLRKLVRARFRLFAEAAGARFGSGVLASLVLVLRVGDAWTQNCEPDFSGNLARGEQIAQRQCAPCHGTNGISVSAQFPNLAGQLPEYLVKQLKAFRGSPTAKPLRLNPVMTPLAAALTDTDFQDLAAYYSRLAPAAGTARNDSRLQLGRKIYTEGNPAEDLPACITCHRPTGTGIRPDFPRLAGQRADYLENQLASWSAVRAKPGKLMTMIVPHLRPEERQAVADYIAQLH
jgi:cytochrome c553